MAIAVTCPKCFKRFQVSDKFAGKKGPCPNCKNTIQVPDKDEAVVVHTPDDGAPKDSQGRSVAKPIERTETDVTRKGLIITSTLIVAVVAAAVTIRLTFDPTPLWLRIVSVLVIAPPLVWSGYSFVRDSELAGYVGTELRDRVAITSVLLSATWCIYWFVPAYLFDLDQPSQMTIVWFGMMVAVMLGVGGIICSAAFELETSSGLIHAGVVLIATVLLAAIAGIPMWGQPIEDDLRRSRRSDATNHGQNQVSLVVVSTARDTGDPVANRREIDA